MRPALPLFALLLHVVHVPHVLAQTPPPAAIGPAEFAARRAALARAVSEDVVLAMGAPEPREDYVRFAQTPTFRYLTDIREPEAVLLGVRRDGTMHWTVFVQPRDPAVEVWTGRRTGYERAAERWGIAGRPRTEFARVRDSVLAGARSVAFIGEEGTPDRPTPDDLEARELQRRFPALTLRRASGAVARLRAAKSPAEIALLRRSIAITMSALDSAARVVAAGVPEYVVEATVERGFRAAGSERPSFSTIIGSGPNGTTLHYNANDRVMQAGELVVADVGASYDGYAADVTRTIPVDGRFSPAQRALYQIVRDAQTAAEAQARAGVPASVMSDSAARTLAEGLTRLGLIDSATATYDCGPDGAKRCSQLSLYYMHGLGHGIGLEVHDPDVSDFPGETLAVGSVFTIEPGLYVRGNLLDILPRTPANAALIDRIRPAVNRYADMGVRIEDDYLVTAQGLEWLSRGPREITEIESMMRRRTLK